MVTNNASFVDKAYKEILKWYNYIYSQHMYTLKKKRNTRRRIYINKTKVDFNLIKLCFDLNMVHVFKKNYSFTK